MKSSCLFFVLRFPVDTVCTYRNLFTVIGNADASTKISCYRSLVIGHMHCIALHAIFLSFYLQWKSSETIEALEKLKHKIQCRNCSQAIEVDLNVRGSTFRIINFILFFSQYFCVFNFDFDITFWFYLRQKCSVNKILFMALRIFMLPIQIE